MCVCVSRPQTGSDFERQECQGQVTGFQEGQPHPRAGVGEGTQADGRSGEGWVESGRATQDSRAHQQFSENGEI